MRSSVFTAVGGAVAFRRLAAAHHARCLADPELEHPFSHGVRPDHVERLGAYWAEVLGGPPHFTEAQGEQSSMLDLHAHNGAHPELGERFLACFLASIDDAGLPSDPELRAVLRDYMTWAVGEVMACAPYDAVVARDLSLPRWSWDGLVSGPAPA